MEAEDGQLLKLNCLITSLLVSVTPPVVVTEPRYKSSNPADQFQWLPKEHMCVLVYLVSQILPLLYTHDMLWVFKNFCYFLIKVTVMHSMQAGFMEKANKYTEKALMQISKLKSKMWK